ncbi:FtsW/RodA/SpoVE family cell cycle protein [Butyrivibrio hungatei]|uniref:FtsW/RodA/SpoVE family cell cycle protein n=1 Tax=Butyrivibrio hungatei TaxID=185008 RepID=UPI000481D86B|nr:FtsW/RodA/SpoVE family cell cycle protein [Butyrivibrio hungatei]
MLKKYKITEYDFFLVTMILITNIFGILAVTSSFPSLKTSVIGGSIFSFLVMVFLSLVDYNFLLKFNWLYYIANLVILALIFTSMGKRINGARRWLQLVPGVRIQPCEVAKILLILFFAQFIMKYKDKVKDIRFIFVCFALLSLPVLLIILQPDLSTCIMIFVTFACMLFVAGMDWKLVAIALAVAVPLVLFVISDAVNGWGIVFGKILHDYQGDRILAWLHPEDFTTDKAYQTLHSLMAIGSGGIRGKGYNTDDVTVLNAGFISEPQSDFVFAVIGEEFGFIGGCAVIILILIISVRCFLISFRAKDKAGQLLAAGIGAWIGFQGFINISVVTGLFPNTGLPLPFISAGSSALLSMYAGMGIVLNVRLQSNKYI